MQKQGFTLIEILITLTVLLILVGISAIGVGAYMENARDRERGGKILLITTALEKYYDTHGEYPSCQSLTSPDASAAKTILNLKSDEITMPNGGSFVCLSSASNLESEDAIEYLTNSTEATPGTLFGINYWSESKKAVQNIHGKRGAI